MLPWALWAGNGRKGWRWRPLCHAHRKYSDRDTSHKQRSACTKAASRAVLSTHSVLLPAGYQGAGQPQELHRHLQDRSHVLPPAIELGQKCPQALTAR